ncbi:MAG TPA: DUF5709 domain-containing protein [Actinocrinis sp.]|nr:DUF5709 domain-containing protein [Actinocrinis sp.]
MSEQNTDLDTPYDDVLEDEGVLQPSETLDTDDLDQDPLDTGISPRERHPASEGFGVTLAEARTGETLDQRLAQEEPDTGEDGPAAPQDSRGQLEDDEFPFGDAPEQPRAGRLLAEDEGSHATTDPSYFVRDVGIDGGAAGAEEAAMHLIEEDDDYVDEDPEY